MSKIKPFSKVVPFILIVSILFTACDIPDISEFTTQSAEMTRGIRTGIKDTGEVLKNASERNDLFESGTLSRFKNEEEKYQRVMKPTLKTLDSLDSYLEALNALSKSNKKAGDNSKAVVGAVGNLVTAVSGITLAASAINIASGILAAGEKFRTAKSFKDRVNKAAEIVEGRYNPIIDPATNKEIGREKKCTDDSKNKIEDETKTLADNIKTTLDTRITSLNTVDAIEKIATNLFDEESAEILKNLSANYVKQNITDQFSVKKKSVYDKLTTPTEKDKFLANELKASSKSEKADAIEDWKTTVNTLSNPNKQNVIDSWKALVKKQAVGVKLKTLADTKLLTATDEQTIKDYRKTSDDKVYEFGCGVIDLLKFTLEDLKVINSRALSLMARNSKEKNDVVLSFYDGIENNDKRTQNELRFILDYKDLVASLKEKNPNNLEANKTNADLMLTVRNTLDSLFILDGQLKSNVQLSLNAGGCNCGKMKDFLTKTIDSTFNASITVADWNNGISVIETDLNARAATLYTENQKYLAELERITPSHKVAVDELAAFENKQIQMNKFLDASVNALDTWADTHANLRVALNTKKTLTVSALTSNVKEIWSIIDPEEAK